MKNTILPIVKDFIDQEKFQLSLSEDSPSEFWLDYSSGSLTVRFKINNPTHQIFYDIYSPEFTTHLKEETIQDVEKLEYLAEENRRWNIAQKIEEIWLILDEIKLWANKNNYHVQEKQLIQIYENSNLKVDTL